MDEQSNHPEVQYRERQRSAARDLGLIRLLPINTSEYPRTLFEELWEKMLEADYAADDNLRGDKELFATSMLIPGTYNFEIPGHAFVQLKMAAPNSNAEVHFLSLAKGPTAPMLEATTELFWFAFEKVKVHRISAFIPSFNGKTIRLATIMRMKFEGSLRKAFLYNKEYYNLEIYGLLASEYKRKG